MLDEEQNLDNSNIRLLVIEDDEGLNEAFTKFLNSIPDKNLKIYNATDGMTGMEYAMRLKPHLIVLDLCLPRLSGMEIYENIKGSSDTRGTKFLITSGNICDYPKDEEFLQKPFLMTDFLIVVNRLINAQNN